MIRPVTLFVLVLRLMLMVMFATAVANMLVPTITFLLELAVRILTFFLAAQTGSRNQTLEMRGHGVLT